MTKVSIDSCVIIDILADNPGGGRTSEEWAGIQEIISDLDAGRLSLVLPSIAFAEIIPSHHPQGLSVFEQVTQRSNVEVIDATVGIAKLAARLKDRSMALSKKIRTLDALFLATAELARVKFFYTTDGRLNNVAPHLDLSFQVERPKARRISLFPGFFEAPTS